LLPPALLLSAAFHSHARTLLELLLEAKAAATVQQQQGHTYRTDVVWRGARSWFWLVDFRLKRSCGLSETPIGVARVAARTAQSDLLLVAKLFAIFFFLGRRAAYYFLDFFDLFCACVQYNTIVNTLPGPDPCDK